jgi:hypothetical protein
LGFYSLSICKPEDYEETAYRNISAMRQGIQKTDISEQIADTKNLHEELDLRITGTQVEMETTPRGLETRKENSEARAGRTSGRRTVIREGAAQPL